MHFSYSLFQHLSPNFLDSIWNRKIKQIKAFLSIFAFLPYNQPPRVQPSAQQGGCGRRTSTEGGSFRLPRIQAGGGEREREKKRVRTPTQTYAAQTKPAVIFKGCSYSITKFQGTIVAWCNLRANKRVGGLYPGFSVGFIWVSKQQGKRGRMAKCPSIWWRQK